MILLTTEIAIMNKTGIALATDSAVTIGNGNKFYNSANKLFNLSKKSAVGIMAYSDAEYMGIPIEIIIKMYRKQSNDKSFDTLEEHWEDFLDYIKISYSNREEKKYYLREIYAFFDYLADSINDELQLKLNEKETLDENELKEKLEKNIIPKIVKKKVEEFSNYNDDNNYISEKERIEQKYSKDIKEAIERFIYKELPIEIEKQLIKLAIMILTKEHPYGGRTGIVIAGYGEKDLFPKLISGEFLGTYFGKLKYNKKHNISINDEQQTFILPFAQGDVIRTFMEGIDPDIKNCINNKITDFINKKECDDKKHCLNELRNELYEEISNISQEKHINQIMDTVHIAPKEELPNMAETLVNLTSFRRNLSMDNFSQSVGGPIDVALISKGDGFIWIKRKHYFNKELNYNFFNNY